MSTLRISDAPLLPDVEGTEKIPTGGRGDYAISVDQIKDHIFQDVGKELVGLGNVDNTSDLDKPVSTAQQAALDLKADKTYVDTNLDLKADKTNVYTRTETSLALSKKADLVGGVIPENQIPSSFNDVLEFTTPNLPLIGESGKIYVTTDTNKTWRWGGNKYIEISGWNPDSVSKRVTLPTYYTKEAGVDTVTGVPDGAYFNVRSSSDESYIDEYQNVGGSAVATGKSYLSALGVQLQEKAASTIKDASGKTQQYTNDRLYEINGVINYGSPNNVQAYEFGLKAIVSGVSEINVKTLGISAENTAEQNKVLLDAAISLSDKVIFRVDDIIKLDPITIPTNKAVSFYGLGGFTVDKLTSVLFTAPESSTLYFNNLIVDGNDMLQRFFVTSGNIWFRGIQAKRLRSTSVSASVGVVSYTNSNNTIALLEKNTITDISGVLTGSLGESAGATRAFTIQSPTLPTNKTLVVVRHNKFDNIFGREGDIVHCYDALTEANAPLSLSEVRIYENDFGYSNRRGIKVQGSNVKIYKNKFDTLDKSHPEWGRDGEGGAGIISLGSQLGHNANKGNEVFYNTFNNNGGLKNSIYLQGNINPLIIGNTHTGIDGGSFFSVSGASCKQTEVIGNTINGECGAFFGNGQGFTYSRNIHNIRGPRRSISDGMTDVPSDMVITDNIINIDNLTNNNFLGMMHFAGITSPFDMKGALIKGNTINNSGANSRGSLIRLPGSDFVLTNLSLIANYTHSTNLVSAAGFKVGFTSSNLIGNTTSGGLYPQVLMKGNTESRPANPVIGQRYYDTTLLPSGKPIEWNGAQWVDGGGIAV